MRFVSPILILGLLGACGGGAANGEPGGDEGNGASGVAASDRPASCPAQAPAPHPLPGVEPRHRTADYWLARVEAEYGDPNAVLLDSEAVRNHNRGLALPVEGRPLGQIDLTKPIDRELLLEETAERITYLREKLTSGAYVDADGDRIGGEALEPFEGETALPSLSPSLHVARGDVPLRCGPREAGFYTESLDLDFDRNNCSTVHEGEIIQVLATWEGGMRLARTPYALGWIADDAPLGDALAPEEAAAALDHDARAVTRRAVIERAFALLDAPYGWGGHEGGRDCSRYLMDVFGAFGLGLPRHSGRQALAGTFSIDVSEAGSAREKRLLIESAAERGMVLLHFPGHIMLYLGETEEGVPMAIHAFSEYVEPCDEPETLPDGEPAETLRRVDRVTVSDLSLGEGSSRTSFLERITRITVLGEAPGVALQGAAELRAAAPTAPPEACEDPLDVAIFRSPATPNAQQPLKVIVTASEDPGPVELALFDPEGNRHSPTLRRLGGPPWTYWVKVEEPAVGRWTAVLGDGTDVHACEHFNVLAAPLPDEPPESQAVWEPKWKWEVDTENLYAAWVEQLFDYPVDEDLTWSNLQSLLQDPDRNLLFDHLSQDEEARLRLEPDCADLPYFLRAYFAWKLNLPFAFRRCNRGAAGRPPRCGPDLNGNLAERERNDDVNAFSDFARDVANGVHSGSARTHPEAEDTDNYPVPLTREALRPGTVFADPHGHLLVIADWVPQGVGSYGVLVGVDAQPDGTIGRRRFWRGSFLFTPDTEDVGAGFKAWRPLVVDPEQEALVALDNDTLRGSEDHVPFSLAQYEGSADDFYARMEALINPRPLDPMGRMRTLVDALEEAVARRVVSVNNGIEYMRGRGWSPIEMPTGYDLFETSGAWEDYSTPARDMRLLISIDAVRGFPDAVAAQPDRFGIEPDDAEEAVARLREALDEELRGRSFSYTRSDGSEQSLTLRNVVDRAERFEMAYHPNDCVEIRWGATPQSDEMSTCNRNAPRDHRARMERYREWFQNRQRPPR